MARAAGVISLATFLSRILGLVREQVFAAQFGAGYAVDAFQVAFRVPNLLRDSSRRGDERRLRSRLDAGRPGERPRRGDATGEPRRQLPRRGFGDLIGILAAPWIVQAIAPGLASVPEARADHAHDLDHDPFLLIVSLAAAVMGILNTRRIFFSRRSRPRC